ncbi:uncharacterized protein LOC125052752 isoform X2 [Pieris napi]|uniref:uncharacterized protein LOC125052752 isoform X2 n=1 Tax=Pieris napi TaxID=78633 RepID=UPI001FBB3AB8|nr:uncharacterized protein LOC125052752 isoform X2 [Pieris napi]
MKRIMRILFLMSFVYLLKADEDATPDESKTTFEDYPSIELAITPMDIASDMDEKPDYAYLKDPSSEEVYKAAKVSIQYKDSSSELKSEKDSEKAVENLNNTDTAGTSHSLNHKIISELPNSTDSNNQNQTLIDKSVHDSNIINENKTISDSQEVKKPDAQLVGKTFKSDLENSSKSTTTPKPKTTIDDIDDLILDKYIKNYDDDEFNKSLYHETQNKSDESDSELDGLDHDFRPSRRMFDFVPGMNFKGSSESHQLLQPSIPINAPQPPFDDRPNPSNTFSPILLPNRHVPDPYRLKNIRLPHNYNEGPFQFGDSRDMLNPNSRETLFGPNDAEENKLKIQNGLGILQEMINNPNRMAPEIPDEPGPNKWDQAPTLYNEPNTWIPNVMTVPNSWKPAPGYQNIPNGLLHLSTINIPNGFIPTGTKLSQEVYDPTDFKTNGIFPFEYTTLDSNAYPYDLAKRAKITETNINPIYRNLALPSSLPNTQLPYFGFGIIRYPGAYPTFDPRMLARRNLALFPSSQRFLIDNGFLYNRMCCY